MNRRLVRYLRFVVLGKIEHRSRRKPRRRRRVTPRDRQYLAFIRLLPCAACGIEEQSEAAHTGSDGGMSLKASDYSAIPLCVACHRTGEHAYHRLGRVEFLKVWFVDLQQLVGRLNAAYRRGAGVRANEEVVKEWIIQRCTQKWAGTELLYQDWPGYCEHLMTRAEMQAALSVCQKKWMQHEFRGHNVANCRDTRHVHKAMREARNLTPGCLTESSEGSKDEG